MRMTDRAVLSPLTNTPRTPCQLSPNKYLSPSGNRVVGLGSGTPTLNNFIVQDDGVQRKERRRKSQAFELHKKVPQSPVSDSPRTGDVYDKLTNAQLANHYADCIKLSAENKINAKNAFGLHLIDYMSELLHKKELENFQVASSALDASVKIYAGRVDFIHSHTYKVLSGLGGGKGAHEEADEIPEEDGENKEPDLKHKKKKKAGKSNTIELNLKNINVDKFDLEFEVDPMFQIMSAAFDEGGASGLLLNRLKCLDDQQQIVLDSDTAVSLQDLGSSLLLSQKPVDVYYCQELLSGLSLEDKQICPSLNEFRFSDWNGETSAVPAGFSDFAFDPTAEPQHLPTVEEEAEAIAHEDIAHEDISDTDEPTTDIGGLCDNVQGLAIRNSSTANFVESAFNDLTHGSLGKLRQILALEPTDYCYFNKVLMRTWAGPAHWTIAPQARAAPNLNSQNKTHKKKPRKAALRLTFDTPDSELDQLFKMSRATTITKVTWSKYTKKRTTLPEDRHIDSQDKLFRLFNKPHMMVKCFVGDSIGVDDGIENYDYSNKNDVDNFCPDVRDDDDDDNHFFDLSNETNAQQMSQNNLSSHNGLCDSGLNGTVLTQDRMVAAPNKVAKLDIKYAKTAKRVDVRKLKHIMWSLLSKKQLAAGEGPQVLDQFEDVPSPVDDNTHTNEDMRVQSLQHFNRLINNLPGSVTINMAKNLTIQTVFACLLYITNEKNLKLSGSETMDDVSIEQD